MANLIRVAHTVGWSFVGAMTIDTGEGTFSLQRVSPAAMERRFRVDYQRMLDGEATRCVVGDSWGFDQHGRRRILHFAAMRAERNRMIRQGRHSEARTLLRLVIGTVWTPARVCSIFGSHQG